MKYQRKKRPRSTGAVLLARTALTHEQIAAKLKCQREQVSRWLAGTCVPGTAWREALFVVFTIPPDAWDQPVAPVALAPAPLVPPEDRAEPTVDGTLQSRVSRLQRMIDDQLSQLEYDRGAMPLERAKVMSSVAATLSVLGRITGEAQEIGESRILRLPAWRRIEDTIVAAVADHPEASDALADALAEIRERAGQ